MVTTTSTTATKNSKKKSWYGSIKKVSSYAGGRGDGTEGSNSNKSVGTNDETQPLIESGDDGDGDVGTTTSSLKNNESYPNVVNEEQLELLELMDTVISSTKRNEDEEDDHLLHVSLPRITCNQVRENRGRKQDNNESNEGNKLNESIIEFVCSSFLGYPLLALVITIGLGIVAIIGIDYQDNPTTTTTKQYMFTFLSTKQQQQRDVDVIFDIFLFPIYPCLATLISFFCMYFMCIQKRLKQYSKEIEQYVGLLSMKQSISNSMEQWMMNIISKIDIINMKLTVVVDNLCGKLTRVKTSRKRRRKVNKILDPTIVAEIPTSSTTQRSDNDFLHLLRTAKEELRTSIIMFELEPTYDSNISTKWIQPRYLQTSDGYFSRQTLLTLLVCFIVHLLGMYSVYYILTTNTQFQTILLRNEYLIAFTNYVQQPRLTEQVVLWLISFAVEPYIISILLIGWVYFMLTSVSNTVSITNSVYTTVDIEMNLLLKQHGIIFLCHDILEFRMEHVKKKLLNLINLSHQKIENNIVVTTTKKKNGPIDNNNSSNAKTTTTKTPLSLLSTSSSSTHEGGAAGASWRKKLLGNFLTERQIEEKKIEYM